MAKTKMAPGHKRFYVASGGHRYPIIATSPEEAVQVALKSRDFPKLGQLIEVSLSSDPDAPRDDDTYFDTIKQVEKAGFKVVEE